MTTTRWTTRRLAALLLALVPLLLAVGCSKGKGTVKGKIEYLDKADKTYKPMPGGYVAFTPTEGGGGASVSINPTDGTYAINNLPVGTMKVTVQPASSLGGNASAGPGGRRTGGGQQSTKDKSKPPSDKIPEEVRDKWDPSSNPSKHVPIDKKFQDAATTPLEVTIIKGDQTHDFKVE